MFATEAKTCQKLADQSKEFYRQRPCQDTFAIGNLEELLLYILIKRRIFDARLPPDAGDATGHPR